MTKKSRLTIILMVIMFVFLLAAVIFSSITVRGYHSALNAQGDEITNLQSQLSLAKANYEANQNQVVIEVQGVDMERKNRDDAVAQEFISTVTTWANVSEYQTMRNSLFETYGISTDSHFMTTFLPRRPQGLNETSGDANSTFDSMESICVSTNDAGDYTYVTEVTVKTAGALGGIGSAKCVFMYTVSEAGTLSNIDAYTYA